MRIIKGVLWMEDGLQLVYWFHKGGLVMYPLLLCSVLIVAVAVERFVFFRRSCNRSGDLLRQVEAALHSGAWESAQRAANETGGVIGRILAAGLAQHGVAGAMRESFEESTALEATNLRRNLSYLGTIVTMAPLLGLLGTVVGMIGSFNVLDAGNPAAITGGVGEALIATATGLCVAVLALAVHTYFSHRLDNVITDVENICLLALRQARGRAA